MTDIFERMQKATMDTFVRSLYDENERLREQLTLEQLRLQWIARQGSEYSQGIIIDAPGDGDWYVSGDKTSGQGKTFLEALDKAREGE